MIVEAAWDGEPCSTVDSTERQTCSTQPCGVNCVWALWTPWSSCSKTCGPSFRKRNREIKNEAVWGGEPCRSPDSQDKEFCDLGKGDIIFFKLSNRRYLDPCPLDWTNDDNQMDAQLLPKMISLEYLKNTSMTGLDLLLEGLQDDICDYKKLETWLPGIIQFFVTDIQPADADQLDQDEKDYVHFVNIILKHLRLVIIDKNKLVEFILVVKGGQSVL